MLHLLQNTVKYLKNWNIVTKWVQSIPVRLFQARMQLLKLNNKNIRTRCEICSSKLTIKTPGIFVYFTPCSNVYIFSFEHVIAGWVVVI